MVRKLSVQILWRSHVAERRGEGLVFPFSLLRESVWFSAFVNARHRNQNVRR